MLIATIVVSTAVSLTIVVVSLRLYTVHLVKQLSIMEDRIDSKLLNLASEVGKRISKQGVK